MVVAHRPGVFICEVRIPGVVVFLDNTEIFPPSCVIAPVVPATPGPQPKLGKKKRIS